MDKHKKDLEFDLKSLDVYEPASDFASRVTKKAVQELEIRPPIGKWMQWIPGFCAAGFVLILLTFIILLIRYFSVNVMDANIILALQAIGLIAVSTFILIFTDRFLKHLLVR